MGRESVLEVHSGGVVYARTDVLHDIDFSISSGEFVVLLGANGSGKTTLVRALLGLAPLSGGRVVLFGVSLHDFHDWSRIGYVPQRFTAAAGVPATVEEVVTSGRIAHARWFRPFTADDKRAVAEAMQAAGVERLSRERVATLSGGQQQRVLIARALAGEPDLLVLDEPVSSVDLEYQESFAATLARLNESGKTVLLVAHSLGAMKPLVHRAVTLSGGTIAYDGPPAGHLEEPHVHHPDEDLRRGELDRPAGTP